MCVYIYIYICPFGGRETQRERSPGTLRCARSRSPATATTTTTTTTATTTTTTTSTTTTTTNNNNNNNTNNDSNNIIIITTTIIIIMTMIMNYTQDRIKVDARVLFMTASDVWHVAATEREGDKRRRR